MTQKYPELDRFRDHIYLCNECRCGYCREFCPAFNRFRTESSHARGKLSIAQALLNGKIQPSLHLAEIAFFCASCGWCSEICPNNRYLNRKNVDFIETIEALRKELVERSLVPSKVRDFLGNIYKYGNPWKLPREERGRWIEGTRIKKCEPGDEFLYYVGCTGSYDTRGRKIARALGEILVESGVSFGALGSSENCDGNDVKILGEEGLFRYLADQNIELFNRLHVKRIITLSPHAYNAMKNEYPRYGGNFEVIHYTQILLDFIQNGKLDISKGFNARVTYHDPCFLGRYNKEYDTPRKLLQCVPGVELVEMERNRESSYCCGGGGGGYYTDFLNGEDSPNRIRVRDAYGTGAQVLAVACPVCMIMLQDAVKVEGLEEKLIVMDVCEIVRESCRMRKQKP